MKFTEEHEWLREDDRRKSLASQNTQRQLGDLVFVESARSRHTVPKTTKSCDRECQSRFRHSGARWMVKSSK